jgi:hypothetical protein
MTILKFEGVVESGDVCRVSYGDDEKDGAVHVGGRDVVDEVHAVKWSGPVTVAMADERFEGPVAGEMGWGYSEYTPMDPDVLTVGSHNVIEILLRHEGSEITVWIADEPIDIADGAA